MLDYLRLTNFRAFKTAELRFSKLNIFVGPNNSGKSSVISAINLIAQNAKLGRRASGFSLNGPYADLGTYHDVVHGHKSTTRVGIEFRIGKYMYDYQFRYRLQRREIEISRANISDGSHTYTYRTTKDSASHSFYTSRHGRVNLGKSRPRIFGLTFMIPYSAIMDLEKNSEATQMNMAIRRFFVVGINGLEDEFSGFDSIGAFRAPPQRTYLYSGESPQELGRAGENFAQVLAASASSREKAMEDLVNNVGGWLKGAGMGRALEVRSLTNRHFEICVEDRLGLSSNIVDVGFGCSQVLPIIIGGYKLSASRRAPQESIFIAQEPEIHLHPSAAAHLGTFFADLILKRTQCFVETHSENLVLRVARHVAMGHIRPSDVKIFWVGEADGQRSISELRLREDGTFIDDWPEGFFPTRSSETLELARASAKLPSGDNLETSFDG